MYQHTVSWFLSSNPELGDVQTSASGNLFTLSLSEPLSIPSNASAVTCELLQAIVWNSTLNIIEGVNDMFYYAVNGFPTSVQVPEGNYDLHIMSETLSRLMFANIPSVPLGSFALSLKGPYCLIQNSIVSSSNYISQIQMGLPRDVSRALGFFAGNLTFSQTVVVGASEGFVSQQAPPLRDGAKEWLLSSSLVARGVRINGRFDQVLAKVSFENTPPGSQLVFNPSQPNVVPAQLGPGSRVSQVTSWLTDAATGLPISTNGESWSYIAVLKYDLPLYTADPEKKRKLA